MDAKKKQSIYEFILKVQGIAKIGMLYSKDPFALENYEELNIASKTMLEHFEDVLLDRPNYFSKDLYPTPNVSVRVVIFNEEGNVLLVKEKSDGGFTIPGGWADLFETPVQAAVKECFQEAGAEVEITRLVGVYAFDFIAHQHPQSHYALVFQAKLLGPLAPIGHEISEVGFYPPTKLPSPISRKIKIDALKKMIDHARFGVTHFE